MAIILHKITDKVTPTVSQVFAPWGQDTSSADSPIGCLTRYTVSANWWCCSWRGRWAYTWPAVGHSTPRRCPSAWLLRYHWVLPEGLGGSGLTYALRRSFSWRKAHLLYVFWRVPSAIWGYWGSRAHACSFWSPYPLNTPWPLWRFLRSQKWITFEFQTSSYFREHWPSGYRSDVGWHTWRRWALFYPPGKIFCIDRLR